MATEPYNVASSKGQDLGQDLSQQPPPGTGERGSRAAVLEGSAESSSTVYLFMKATDNYLRK